MNSARERETTVMIRRAAERPLFSAEPRESARASRESKSLRLRVDVYIQVYMDVDGRGYRAVKFLYNAQVGRL